MRLLLFAPLEICTVGQWIFNENRLARISEKIGTVFKSWKECLLRKPTAKTYKFWCRAYILHTVKKKIWCVQNWRCFSQGHYTMFRSWFDIIKNTPFGINLCIAKNFTIMLAQDIVSVNNDVPVIKIINNFNRIQQFNFSTK